MNAKNFLKIATVLMAMAMTSVMMISCTGNEDNTVVLPDEGGNNDQPVFQSGNVILKAGEGQGDEIVLSVRDKTYYYGFLQTNREDVQKGMFFDDNYGLFYRLPDCPKAFTAPGGKEFELWYAEWGNNITKYYAPGDFHLITFYDTTITAIWKDSGESNEQ